jgi:hypothetical protein
VSAGIAGPAGFPAAGGSPTATLTAVLQPNETSVLCGITVSAGELSSWDLQQKSPGGEWVDVSTTIVDASYLVSGLTTPGDYQFRPANVRVVEELTGNTVTATIPVPAGFTSLKFRARSGTQPSAYGILAAGRSAAMRVGVPGPNVTVTRARIWFRNASTTAGTEIVGARIAPVATLAGNTGNGGAWSADLGVVSLPAATVGANGAINFAEAPTPWVAFAPVARSDGGVQRLADIVFKVGPTLEYKSVAVADPPADNTSQFSSGWSNSATDFINPPPDRSLAAYAGGWAWVEYEIEPNATIKTVVICGDSVADGSSASVVEGGYLQRGCYNKGVYYTSYTQGGRTTAETVAIMQAAIPVGGLYSAVFLRPWSANDQIQGYTEQQAWDLYVAERARLEGLGYIVLTESPLPKPTIAPAIPLNIKNRLIAAGHPFCDSGRTVATSDTLQTWTAAYTADNIHPDNDGIAALIPVWEAYLVTMGLAT